MVWKKSGDMAKLGLLQTDPVQNYGTVPSIRKNKPSRSETVEKSTFLGLFRHSTCLDVTLMVVGTIFSILSGTTLPLLGFYFGGMTDVFVKQAVQGLVPDFIVNKTIQTAIRSAEMQKLQVVTEVTPVNFEDRNHLVYRIIYKIVKTFEARVPKALSGQNDPFNGLPLTESEFRDSLNAYLLIYLLIGTFMMLCSFVQTLCWEYSSEHRVNNMRKIYFSQILRQDIAWYDMNENGNLPNKLSDDLERIREGTGYRCAMIVQYVCTFLAGVAIGLLVNWQLTLIVLCVGPFLVFLNMYSAGVAARNLAEEQKRYAMAGAIVEETLTNIKTVNAFCGHAVATKRYFERLEEGRRITSHTFTVYTICYSLTFFLMYLAYAVGFWFGTQMVEDGFVTPGSIFTVFFTVIIGAFSIGNALPFFNVVSGSVGIAASVNKIISRQCIIDPYSLTGRQLFHATGHIKFKNVSFVYPSRSSIQILNGLNLDIEPGKITAIVGSSGGGKSTIISLILRYYDPSEGQICFDDVPLSELNVKWLRSQIGLVSQEPILFGVSIAENIKYGRENVTDFEIKEAAKQANAHEFITNLPQGYDTLVGDAGSQLSGGQKQRIAIARALIRDPKILLLDEATSALDSRSEGIVQDTLTKVMKGRTTVIIAHRLSTIKNADVIYVLQNGKLFESGRHNELMAKRSLYYNLVIVQRTSKHFTIDQESTTTETESDTLMSQDLGESDRNSNEEKETGLSDSRDTSLPEIKKTETIGILYKTEKAFDGETKDRDKINCLNVEQHAYETDVEGLQKRKNGTPDTITEEERSRIPFTRPENIEKDYSFYEVARLQTPDWPWWMMAFVGSICVGIIMPIFGLYYGEIFKVFTLSGMNYQNATIFWTYMLLALAIFSTISYAVQVKGITHACEKMIVRTRALAFENTLKQPVGWFDLETSSPGIIGNRLARNGPIIKSAAGLRTAQVIVSVVTITCAFLISFYFNWILASILFFFVPLVIYASYKQQVLLRRNQVRDTKLMDDAGRVASEAVRNIRTIQALCRENLFTILYAKYLELPYKEAIKQAHVYALLYAATQGITYYMYGISFRIGGWLVESGRMKANTVYTVFFALSLCATCVGMAFSYLQDYSKARTSLKLLNYLITRRSEIDATSPVGLKPDIKGYIEFRDVHFCYPARRDVKVLKGLQFTIEAGKTLALVGESGCGKSTVISLLERFYDPISGDILFDGFGIQTYNIAYLRSKIGIVTQEPVLFNTTIRDNIAYGAVTLQKEVTYEQIQRAATIANIHDFIQTLPHRYDTMVGERGVQLSGGQKQRVAIARALIRDPKILLLDEATSALDAENEKIVQAALDKAKQGRTCIIVAHRLSTIQNADKICVVHEGKIVESGNHEELLKLKGYYYLLTQRQFL